MKKVIYPALFVLILFATACSSNRTSTTAKNYKVSSKSAKAVAPSSTDSYAPSNGVPVGMRAEEAAAMKSLPATGEGVSGKAETYGWSKDVPAVKMDKSLKMPTPVELTRAPGTAEAAETEELAEYKSPIEQNAPKAGQITAAEWNDLHNWKDWNELVEKPAFKNMKDAWDIQLRDRFSVFVTNEQDLPVTDAEVQLLNEKGHIIWEARTDNAGKAELWNGIEREPAGAGDELVVNYKGESKRIKKAKRISEGVNNIQLPVSCSTPNVAEVMFVVDATGSMSDEINFLKAELGDVINRVQKMNDALDIRLGSVFYRDDNCKYLTRVSALSSDITKTTQFISEQEAGGGGDYPEAVEEGLAQAINQNWSDEAVARIIFMLLDAPPHDDEASKKKMREQIELAAQKGIKIVPVSASGINRQTEFLLKFASIISNGTYIFITDDSGIGNPHLAPVVNDFQVEFLNDALVRVIESYTRQNSCETITPEVVETEELIVFDDEGNQATDSQTSTDNIDEEIINQQGTEEITSWMDEITIYPNPANTFVNIKTPRDLDRVDVLGASGIVLITERNVSKGTTRIDLEPLVDGFYFLQCYSEDRIETKKLVKKRSNRISFK